MKKCKFEEELPRMIPHCLHLMVGVATLVVASKALHKLCHIHKGLKEIREGHKEIIEGRKEILGRK